MAIDTRDRRASAVGLQPNFLQPLPDGSVDDADRWQITWVYRGLAAVPPTQQLLLDSSGSAATDGEGSIQQQLRLDSESTVGTEGEGGTGIQQMALDSASQVATEGEGNTANQPLFLDSTGQLATTGEGTVIVPGQLLLDSTSQTECRGEGDTQVIQQLLLDSRGRIATVGEGDVRPLLRLESVSTVETRGDLLLTDFPYIPTRRCISAGEDRLCISEGV